jgi:hypothetical protein
MSLKQGGPPEPVAVGLGEPELLGDEVVEGPYPLRVAACGPVVDVQGPDQHEDLLGAPRRLVVDAVLLGVGQLLLEVADRPRPKGHTEAGRGTVREHHGEP